LGREVYRRRLRGKGPLDLKSHPPKRHEGEILSVAKSPVIVVSPTTRIYDAIEIMAKRGFRRLPVTDAGTRHLEGIITATDIVDYLGGGKKFEIVQRKFGGNLFKAINEPVRIIMTRKVVSISTLAKISEAIGTLKKANLGGLPVVDANKSVRAIITERDIMNLFSNRISAVQVAQLMSEKVVTALPKTTIFETEKTMIAKGFRRLPIVSDGKVMGILTTMDIIRFFGLGKVFRYLRSGTIIQVLNTPALDIATRQVSIIAPDTDVGKAAKVMREKDIGALPVVKNEKLVGIITERDFFKIIE
jgi:CBS domain-containing protein